MFKKSKYSLLSYPPKYESSIYHTPCQALRFARFLLLQGRLNHSFILKIHYSQICIASFPGHPTRVISKKQKIQFQEVLFFLNKKKKNGAGWGGRQRRKCYMCQEKKQAIPVLIAFEPRTH